VSGPVFTKGVVTVVYLPPPLFRVLAYFFNLIEGFVGDCQGLLLWPFFAIGVHSADESVISPDRKRHRHRHECANTV